MKIAKNYNDVPTIYYKPEIQKCLACGKELKRSHKVWDKYIIDGICCRDITVPTTLALQRWYIGLQKLTR
jgi:hypothetical protein